MDIRCRHCREPWDNDTIHEEVAERQAQEMVTTCHIQRGLSGFTHERHTYATVYEEFKKYGCGAFVAFMGSGRVDSQGRTIVEKCKDTHPDPGGEVLSTIYELMGDDSDGAMSMIEDAESAGLL